ncbi:PhoH family protein [candidate division KSB1 bacterium]|nr:PhoH family protein [candidate division KSB1 bacterium]
MSENRIKIKGAHQLELVGTHDENFKIIEAAFDVQLILRGDEVQIKGDDDSVGKAGKVLTELRFLLERNRSLGKRDVETVVDLINLNGSDVPSKSITREKQDILLYGKKQLIRPKTEGQKRYIQSVLDQDIVFCIGPAGTGKTYLAVAIALALLKEKKVTKIVLTRPAIEAGESLGYLPGDLMEKVDPYLRPLTDALFDMLPSDQLQKYVDHKVIEIVPLGYMRGRTMNNAFVILDEAQNATPMQMKMFLTRLGVSSKAVATGDITQTDLPETTQSGLMQIQEVLKGIDGIGFVYMDKTDVVRHRLVKEIIAAYETFHQNGSKKGN